MSSAATEPIQVLLVDDHVLVRQGLRMLIESDPDFAVVGEAQERAGALGIATRDQPDVVLLDLDLGTESGLDLIGELKAAAPRARILILTGVRDPDIRRRAIVLGAMGLVEKEVAHEVLLKAIRKVAAGEAWLDHAMTASVLAEMGRARKEAQGDPEAAKIASLSPRELEVIALLGEGLANKGIADRLCIAETTVRHHLTSIFSKLEVRDRLELLLYAYRRKLIKPPTAV